MHLMSLEPQDEVMPTKEDSVTAAEKRTYETNTECMIYRIHTFCICRFAEPLYNTFYQTSGSPMTIYPTVNRLEAKMHLMSLEPQDEVMPTKEDSVTAAEKRTYETNTECMNSIRDEWGIHGTMNKIMKHLKSGPEPVTIKSLLAAGPTVPGYGAVIAAKCFTSLAKLKEQGYIHIIKDPNTLEIKDVILSIERFGTDHLPQQLCELRF